MGTFSRKNAGFQPRTHLAACTRATVRQHSFRKRELITLILCFRRKLQTDKKFAIGKNQRSAQVKERAALPKKKRQA
jgi:hypothetical protein